MPDLGQTFLFWTSAAPPLGQAVREAKARLEQQLARLQGEHQALAEKLQLCAALQGEARPADLETALAVVRAARLKGRPGCGGRRVGRREDRGLGHVGRATAFE